MGRTTLLTLSAMAAYLCPATNGTRGLHSVLQPQLEYMAHGTQMTDEVLHAQPPLPPVNMNCLALGNYYRHGEEETCRVDAICLKETQRYASMLGACDESHNESGHTDCYSMSSVLAHDLHMTMRTPTARPTASKRNTDRPEAGSAQTSGVCKERRAGARNLRAHD